jgi:hypothetical protein
LISYRRFLDVLLFVPAWVSCRWEARLPVHQQEGERTQVPRDREEDPGGELCGSLCSGLPVMVPRVVLGAAFFLQCHRTMSGAVVLEPDLDYSDGLRFVLTAKFAAAL